MTWVRVIGSLIVRPHRAPPGADERRMLDAVIAEPDDDGPRLVYADWLLAQREPLLVARGELIVVQCMVERTQDPADHARLRGRDEELVAQHGNTWCAELGLGSARYNWYDSDCGADFHRGFIDGVVIPTADFAGVAGKLFGSEPVRHLELMGWGPEIITRLPASVYLARLRALVLRSTAVQPAQLARLAASDHVAGLERLDVVDAHSGDVGAAAIAGSSALGGLRELSLAATEVTALGAFEVASGRLAGQLEVLVLDGNPIGDAGAGYLVASQQLTRLRRLSLRGIELGEASRRALANRFGTALEL